MLLELNEICAGVTPAELPMLREWVRFVAVFAVAAAVAAAAFVVAVVVVGAVVVCWPRRYSACVISMVALCRVAKRPC